MKNKTDWLEIGSAVVLGMFFLAFCYCSYNYAVFTDNYARTADINNVAISYPQALK